MLDQAESQYKNLHFHTPPWHHHEVIVIFSSTLWLTYEIKYLYENFEDNSK